MSELQVIQTALAQAARRRRWQRAVNGLCRGLLVGGFIWLLALAAYKIFPIPTEILFGAAAFAAVPALVGFVHGWIRKMTLSETARWVDEQQKLQERLSTALELATAGGNENWRTLLISDAARFASKIDPRKMVPFRLPRASQWALLVLAFCAGLGFVPEYRSKEFLEKKQDAVAIKEAGKKIVELTRHNLEHRPPVLEPTRSALDKVEQLGLQLAKNPVTRTEALKDVSSVTEKLKDQLKQLGKDPAFKSLERAARESSKTGATTAGEIQKQMEALQKELGKGANSAALDKLKDELQKVQKGAAGLPNNDSPEAAAARQQMAETLSDLAKKAREMGQQLPSLDEAIAALQANKTDNFIKDLETATQDLEKLQEMAKTLQQLQQQATKMGKDLPEQLKFGQADAAQETLQKMIEQLKSANLSQEQMKKMLDEISRSVDPASPYGKAAEFLKQSAGQCKNGQKADAAQSLAKAADELKKALDEMQDAQALMASLEALKKAEWAIATKKCWGQCPSCGDKSGKCCKAGMCKNGKTGRGVGTWADENNWFYPEMSERWDNSGFNRPDMDPRGLTDRGAPELADNLAPTKLRGQISPGGQMPSITLKGVSIKGQSSVAFQEAAAAAQSEADSALNQDQVPRAYQGAVRDYFDDLKK